MTVLNTGTGRSVSGFLKTAAGYRLQQPARIVTQSNAEQSGVVTFRTVFGWYPV
jgi:hypothetical protein